MGNAILKAVREALPSSGLQPVSRMALLLLADTAPDATGLAWLSQATLASEIGCRATYVGAAVRALEAVGQLSVLRRPGRQPLYLLHPHGAAQLDPLKRGEVRQHLRGWRKASASDIAAALDWLASIGALAGTGAAGPAGPDPFTQSKGGRREAGPFHPVEGHPFTQSRRTQREPK